MPSRRQNPPDCGTVDGDFFAILIQQLYPLLQRVELLYQDSEKIAVNSAAIGRILAT